jgi:hypothetical protein
LEVEKLAQGDDAQISTAKVEADGKKFKLDQETLDYKGQSSTLNFDAKLDGKDYPVSGDPHYDSVQVSSINERKIKVTFKKDGKRVGVSDVTVSNDGKNSTLVYTEFSESTPRKHTSFWEKQ